jgi:Ca2+-binding RTX toxin-like protein
LYIVLLYTPLFGETTHTVYGGPDNDNRLFLETDIGGELFGEGGNDYLSSQFGGTLDGGEGDDIIETLGGADSFTLIGGNGADHFICTTTDEETITDFNPADGGVMFLP